MAKVALGTAYHLDLSSEGPLGLLSFISIHVPITAPGNIILKIRAHSRVGWK